MIWGSTQALFRNSGTFTRNHASQFGYNLIYVNIIFWKFQIAFLQISCFKKLCIKNKFNWILTDTLNHNDLVHCCYVMSQVIYLFHRYSYRHYSDARNTKPKSDVPFCVASSTTLLSKFASFWRRAYSVGSSNTGIWLGSWAVVSMLTNMRWWRHTG